MKMIETTTTAAAVYAIRHRLHSLAIRRITAVPALDLGGDDAQPAQRLQYRNVSVQSRPSLLQLRLLVDDVTAVQAIAVLRDLANTGRWDLGAIVVSPVEVQSTNSFAVAPGDVGESATASYQS